MHIRIPVAVATAAIPLLAMAGCGGGSGGGSNGPGSYLTGSGVGGSQDRIVASAPYRSDSVSHLASVTAAHPSAQHDASR